MLWFIYGTIKGQEYTGTWQSTHQHCQKGTRFTTKCASNSAISYIKMDKVNHLHRQRSYDFFDFFLQMMSLPMESVYKQILVSRIIDFEISLNSHIGKGPVEIMLSKRKGYGWGHEVTNALNTGIIMKIK